MVSILNNTFMKKNIYEKGQKTRYGAKKKVPELDSSSYTKREVRKTKLSLSTVENFLMNNNSIK